LTQTLASSLGAALPPDGGMRVGVVESINPLTVNISGGSVPAGIQGSYKPEVGDNVTVIREASTWLITGRVGGPDMAYPTCVMIQNDAVVNTGVTGLNVYQDMIGAFGNVSKASGSSVMRVHFTASWYVTPAQTGVGVRSIWTPVGGAGSGTFTHQIVPPFRFNVGSQRLPVGRVVWLHGLPAADYAVQFQWAVTFDPGSGTINRNADDFFTCEIEER